MGAGVTDYSETGTADRSLWPEEAVAIADSELLPDDALFFRAVRWPYKTPYDDYMVLPRQPRGERSWRWCPVKVVVGKRPDERVFLYAMKWPERAGVIASGGTARRDVFIPSSDPMEKSA